MKATFEFNMEDSDDRALFETYAQANKLKNAMWEFSQQVLRSNRKHGPTERLKERIKNDIKERNLKLKANDDGIVELDLLLEVIGEITVDFIEDEFYETLSEHEVKIID